MTEKLMQYIPLLIAAGYFTFLVLSWMRMQQVLAEIKALLAAPPPAPPRDG